MKLNKVDLDIKVLSFLYFFFIFNFDRKICRSSSKTGFTKTSLTYSSRTKDDYPLLPIYSLQFAQCQYCWQISFNVSHWYFPNCSFISKWKYFSYTIRNKHFHVLFNICFSKDNNPLMALPFYCFMLILLFRVRHGQRNQWHSDRYIDTVLTSVYVITFP